VDFGSYAQQAAKLANADLSDLAALRTALADRPWFAEQVGPDDLTRVRQAQPDLRGVFELAAAGDGAGAVRAINALLASVPVAPRVSGHDEQSWHLHVTSGAAAGQDLLAEAFMGLAVTVIDLGSDRLGSCARDGCDNVYVDTSPNRSRRYCSDRCSSRANVAAFRARRRRSTAAVSD
jgi:predicted RNA-binding Zn ribbon-like protein